MVVVDIEKHRNVGREFKKTVDKLAGFANERITAARNAGAAYKRKSAADNGGRVPLVKQKNLCYHRGNGSLAVGTANAYGIAVKSRYRTEQF